MKEVFCDIRLHGNTCWLWRNRFQPENRNCFLKHWFKCISQYKDVFALCNVYSCDTSVITHTTHHFTVWVLYSILTIQCGIFWLSFWCMKCIFQWFWCRKYKKLILLLSTSFSTSLISLWQSLSRKNKNKKKSLLWKSIFSCECKVDFLSSSL